MTKAEVFSAYLLPVLTAALTALAGFLGARLKALYQRYVDDGAKRQVVQSCVQAVEQLYQGLDGPEKLKKAQEGALEILREKGIPISRLELNVLIESVVSQFNHRLWGREAYALPEKTGLAEEAGFSEETASGAIGEDPS